jgi:hypothetical protein
MSERKEKVTGIRSDLQKWLKKEMGITLTAWYRIPREKRLSLYAKYQRGQKPSQAQIQEEKNGQTTEPVAAPANT